MSGPASSQLFASGVLVAAALTLGGCKTGGGEVETVGPDEPARRAAQSFVHCVESEGGGCVGRDPKQGSWDAFALLTWLGGGSPTSILQALRRELEHHRDLFQIQDRFVTVTSRYREPLRGAECRSESAAPISELLPRVVSRVETRMQGLGLWRPELEQVVGGLSAEAESGLANGWLVHMSCYGDPYEIWVATTVEDERQVVVGMLTTLPGWLGKDSLDDERVEDRIQNHMLNNSRTLSVVREGTVDSSWIPVPVEEF